MYGQRILTSSTASEIRSKIHEQDFSGTFDSVIEASDDLGCNRFSDIFEIERKTRRKVYRRLMQQSNYS